MTQDVTTDALRLRPILPVTAAVGKSGHLSLGGCDTLALLGEFGSPLYVFDELTLRDKCREYLTEFGGRYHDVSVLYASKAFISLAIARIVEQEGLGLDVVSGGELAVAMRANFPLEKVYFHGNNKSPDELRTAVEAGIGRVVIDNFYELDLLDRIAGAAGRTQPVLLRISPNVDPHTHMHTTTGTLDTKFGIPIETGQGEEAVWRALHSEHLELRGIHAHLGSPIFELDPYERAIEVLIGFAAEMRRHGFALQEFSPGGGFAVQYVQDQPAPPAAAYAEVITDSIRRWCAVRGLPLPHLTIEPGRSTICRAGVALYTAGASKDIPGVRRYVAVDGGMADNVRPAIYGSKYEAMLANRPLEDATETVTIAGKFCESGDILIRDARLPRVEAGDVVAIPASGAYCLAMSSNYNHAPRPAVVLVSGGKARLIRRRESYDDLMRLDVDS
ncbi:MAG TPA: diaminopimelate decarboxylase [Dehalococcoidia bacterium]|nr:diaminopimelate decarboxylase [Dehalococcoidia bacterium]